MRAYLVFSLVVAIPVLASASPLPLPGGGGAAETEAAVKSVLDRQAEGSLYLNTEATKIESELADRKLGDLTVAELMPYRDRLSVAAQKDAFIKEAAAKSFALPGAGQLKMGNAAGGVAFVSLHIGLLVGQAIVPFLALPKDLRRIDYMRDDFKSIARTWASHDFNDFGPAMGVAAAFMVADLSLRVWSSMSAKSEATKRVASGEQEFSPEVGPGFLGFGLRY
jgi:hypothetical protein